MTQIREQLEANNYVILEDFISPKKAKKLYDNYIVYKNEHPEIFRRDEQCPKSLSIYNYKPFTELLVEKVPYMSKKIGELMFPTYCYSRIYTNGEILEKHTDRPACEISITLHLGGDRDWPIYFTKPNGKIASAKLCSGQAVVYLGCKSAHWRDPFKGQEYVQVFLHYVRSQGPNWIYYFDKRK